MAAYIRNESALAALYGRSNYEGTFRPLIAKVRPPVRVIQMRRNNYHLVIATSDGRNVATMVVDKMDSPGLELLTAMDRANAQSALRAMQAEVGDV